MTPDAVDGGARLSVALRPETWSGRPLFLASVRNVAEARRAIAGGAEIIDCKNPDGGALGALDVAAVAAIRAAVPEPCLVTATIGDLVPEAVAVPAAVAAMAASGCDAVKIGWFPGGDAPGAMRALSAWRAKTRSRVGLIGLFLADRHPDFSLLGTMAANGFAGAMIDTAEKSAGPLPHHISRPALEAFVTAARSHGLFAGLAGSLQLSDVAPLAELKPHVMGFRGALCEGGRTGSVAERRVQLIRARLEATTEQHPLARLS